MIVVCPKCHRKNRVPEKSPVGNAPICGDCHTPLPLPRFPSSRFARFCRGSVLGLDYILLLLLGVFSLFDLIGPERWWLTGFFLYMPRWIWAVAAAALLLPTFFLARRRSASGRRSWGMVLGLTAALLWILGPFMGLCLPPLFPARPSPTAPTTRLRVLTYNVKWGWRNAHEIAEEINRSKPDLVQFQDSDGVLMGEVGQIISAANGWTVRISGQYIVASRWNLSPLTPIDISFPGSNHHAIRATLTPVGGGTPITIYNVHLLSARYGLLSVRSRNTDGLGMNMESRLYEANRLAEAIAGSPPGPVLLTGDLNAPPSSLVKKRFKAAGLRDAFEAVGSGYGYTYGTTTKVGHSYVRIDCVMTNPRLRAGAIWVGNDRGSDHCPVIADLYLTEG